MNALEDPAAERFRTVYDAAYPDLLRFVQRRIDPHRAEDVVADAMLVAWRRSAELPLDLGDARAWLFGIARNLLLNDARSDRRREALAVRVTGAGSAASTPPDVADEVVARLDLARAWTLLTPGEQEVLACTVFDGLDSTRAGAVLGISAAAYRLRLSRARRALRRRLEGAAAGDAPAQHSPAEVIR